MFQQQKQQQHQPPHPTLPHPPSNRCSVVPAQLDWPLLASLISFLASVNQYHYNHHPKAACGHGALRVDANKPNRPSVTHHLLSSLSLLCHVTNPHMHLHTRVYSAPHPQLFTLALTFTFTFTFSLHSDVTYATSPITLACAGVHSFAQLFSLSVWLHRRSHSLVLNVSHVPRH